MHALDRDRLGRGSRSRVVARASSRVGVVSASSGTTSIAASSRACIAAASSGAAPASTCRWGRARRRSACTAAVGLTEPLGLGREVAADLVGVQVLLDEQVADAGAARCPSRRWRCAGTPAACRGRRAWRSPSASCQRPVDPAEQRRHVLAARCGSARRGSRCRGCARADPAEELEDARPRRTRSTCWTARRSSPSPGVSAGGSSAPSTTWNDVAPPCVRRASLSAAWKPLSSSSARVLEIDRVVGDHGLAELAGASTWPISAWSWSGSAVVEVGDRALVGVAGAVLELDGDDLDAQLAARLGRARAGRRTCVTVNVAALAGEPPAAGQVGGEQRRYVGDCSVGPGSRRAASSEREIRNQ